jgi:hypothetical protein
MSYFLNEYGDILPFHQILRVGGIGKGVRIYFVNGCADLDENDAREFKKTYLKWLVDSEFQNNKMYKTCAEIYKILVECQSFGNPTEQTE